jgi:NAD(P)H-hydrate epimerase
MQGLKVVTATEMARIEALAIKEGCSQEEFMRHSGARIAEAAEEWQERQQLAKIIHLLIWKGNKSGDAFVAGSLLLAAGFRVFAYMLAPLENCSPLTQKFAEKFHKKGGAVIAVKSARDLNFGKDGFIIDGLLGTGFAGPVEGLLKETIEAANHSTLPVLAIDITSGLNGSTGEVGGVAIKAHLTMTLGLPKIGFFLRDGWNLVGELHVGEFGLPDEIIAQADPVAFLPEPANIKHFLPKIIRNRHKYQAGFVLGFAGSSRYSGAAKLASLASLRGGAGIVNLFYPEEATAQMVSSPYEVIHMPWDEKTWEEALKKGTAVFLGPGIGESKESQHILSRILSHLRVPTVLDADALNLHLAIPPISICTPHRGEMLRLLGEEKLSEWQLLERCQRFCDEKNTVLVLKGAPNWIFTPHQKPQLIARGDPGMATAGSGDVLTGLLASLLAQGCSASEAALLGVMLHALAGEIAAKEKTSHCMIASDLIEYLPKAFHMLETIP